MTMLPDDPARLAEPPPMSHAIRLATEIAGPALRLVNLAALLVLTALLHRLGASTDADAVRAWGAALAGLVVLALLELPARRGAEGMASTTPLRPDIVIVAALATVTAARHWAAIVTLLAAASLAALVAATAAGPRASAAHVAAAVVGLLLARAFLRAGEGTRRA